MPPARSPLRLLARIVPVVLLLALAVIIPVTANAASDATLVLRSNPYPWRDGPGSALIINLNGTPTWVATSPGAHFVSIPTNANTSAQFPRVVREPVDGVLTCWTFSSWRYTYTLTNGATGSATGSAMAINVFVPSTVARVDFTLFYEHWNGDCPGES